jgi:hypothetical protein
LKSPTNPKEVTVHYRIYTRTKDDVIVGPYTIKYRYGFRWWQSHEDVFGDRQFATPEEAVENLRKFLEALWVRKPKVKFIIHNQGSFNVNKG